MRDGVVRGHQTPDPTVTRKRQTDQMVFAHAVRDVPAAIMPGRESGGSTRCARSGHGAIAGKAKEQGAICSLAGVVTGLFGKYRRQS